MRKAGGRSGRDLTRYQPYRSMLRIPTAKHNLGVVASGTEPSRRVGERGKQNKRFERVDI